MSLIGACKDPPPLTNGEVEGQIFGEILSEQISDSLTHTVPYRCARVTENTGNTPNSKLPATLADGVLSFDHGDDNKPLLIAFVADSRGADAETLRNLSTLRSQFVSADVSMVVSLGGIAEHSEEIQTALYSLTEDTNFILVALPGDRESIPAHRTAVQQLTQKGITVVDGSLYPLIQVGNLIIASLPGIGYQSNLIPGDNGCIHTKEDVQALLKTIEKRQERVLLATYAPVADTNHGLGAGSIPIAAPMTASLRESTHVLAVVHGMVDDAAQAKRGKIPFQGRAISLASGAMEPIESRSHALIVSISRKKMVWWRVHASSTKAKQLRD